MFRVKICGVRLDQDVAAVAAAGADAVGLNFFPPSVRYLDPQSNSTRELSQQAHTAGLLRVGVFVNQSAESMLTVADRVGLDAIQLHGDESIETAAVLLQRGQTVIRAIKLPKLPFDVELMERRSADWMLLGCHLLLDVDAGAAMGGSGKTLDWASVRAWAAAYPDVSWTLAGGLKPENVAAAIRATGAISVDSASGVECPKGVKNAERIAGFVAATGLCRIDPGR
ncbi:phosphoribosylanthranilate isomerase [Stieleria sp. TO1_6]|uniref:phosphoribosylanthranilate isomerase n=1 Tax=Stieleria tagensis TaxID=2956795 RepID=UPI00209A7606|nr:phosphoribosylanthranilate isomerase [Stieleria tagensis]MCO8123025.1 phosphoribosylanthranilate isomerase [Stieleria tagensis]